MESRITHRFDRTDDALKDLHAAMATKDDVRAVKEQVDSGLAQVHKRIDGVVERIVPLEQDDAAEKAVEANRVSRRGTWQFLAMIVMAVMAVGGLAWGVIEVIH